MVNRSQSLVQLSVSLSLLLMDHLADCRSNDKRRVVVLRTNTSTSPKNKATLEATRVMIG
jgi:hypothetical protein